MGLTRRVTPAITVFVMTFEQKNRAAHAAAAGVLSNVVEAAGSILGGLGLFVLSVLIIPASRGAPV